MGSPAPFFKHFTERTINVKTTRFETIKDGVSCLWNTADHLPHPWTRSEYDRRARYAVEALTEINPKWGARAKHILIDVADGPQEGVPTNQYDRAYCHLYALWATQHEGYDPHVAGAWISPDGMANILITNDERNQIAGRVRKIADQGWPLTRVWVYDDEDDGLPYVYYLVRPLED